eukprot:16511-Heterococcus_DN1.PRE.1
MLMRSDDLSLKLLQAEKLVYVQPAVTRKAKVCHACTLSGCAQERNTSRYQACGHEMYTPVSIEH